MAGSSLPRLRLRQGLARLVDSLPAIVQLTVAAAASYAIGHWVFGHAIPFLAVTVCITSLTFARDARPRRVMDTAIGITLGVLLANLSLLVIGRGPWQLLLVMVTVMVVARLIHPAPSFAVSATVQASLVSLIPVASGAEYTRLVDAVIGGAVAILATALVPRDARGLARSGEIAFFEAMRDGFTLMVEALRRGDGELGVEALARLRATSALLDAWGSALDTSLAVSRVSPFLRRHVPELEARAELRRHMDLVARNSRVLARRVWSVASDGTERPELANLVADIESAILELHLSMSRPGLRSSAVQSGTIAAVQLDPARIVPRGSVGEVMIVMQARPLIVDLLVAAGVDVERARASLPRVR